MNTDTLEDQVENYVEAVAFGEGKLDALTKKIEKAYEITDADRLLQSIPGVGILTAAYAEAYLAPIERFPDEKSVDS